MMKVKVESEKVGLKLNIQITKIMASCPITSWEIDKETMETVSDFIFWGSKITGRNDAKAETLVLWPSKGPTEDEMAGWHHQLDGREFE